jgi:hypothetical protein
VNTHVVYQTTSRQGVRRMQYVSQPPTALTPKQDPYLNNESNVLCTDRALFNPGGCLFLLTFPGKQPHIF